MFPSLSSDYDVGFIYVHPVAKYLLIDNPASLLTFPFNNKLDLHG
ncbi:MULTISPECIES: DNA polymerase beta superfamily protein [unclassified Snodgrassella]